MSDNVRKYLLYALGEIALVVIGILIALQVNNWNEQRKERAQELKILKKLQTELVADHKALEQDLQNHKSVADTMRALQEIMSVDPPVIDDERVISYMGHLVWVPVYKPKLGVLNSIITSGQISLISNEQLNTAIATWRGLLEEYEYLTTLLNDHDSRITPYLFGRFPIREIHLDKFGIGDSGPSNFEFDARRLLSDPVIETMAEYKRANSESAYFAAKRLYENQELMIELIRQELNRE